MPDKEKIKRFVVETLRCRCPREVFRSIDCCRQVRLVDEVVLHSTITIGKRLFIYVAEAGNQSFNEKHLAFLVAAGRSEGDSKGLNRFRLAMVTDGFPENGDIIGRAFDELREGDEKIHLHVISRNNKYLDF